MRFLVGLILIIPQLIVAVIQQLVMFALMPVFLVIAIFKVFIDNNKDR